MVYETPKIPPLVGLTTPKGDQRQYKLPGNDS